MNPSYEVDSALRRPTKVLFPEHTRPKNKREPGILLVGVRNAIELEAGREYPYCSDRVPSSCVYLDDTNFEYRTDVDIG